jgi:hypothetical protein
MKASWLQDSLADNKDPSKPSKLTSFEFIAKDYACLNLIENPKKQS